MKCLVVLACFLMLTYAAIPPELMEKFKERVHKLAGECKTEIGTSEDDIKPIMNHEPPTTEKGKCFIACVNKKMGLQDASGKISKDKAMSLLDKLKAVDKELYGKVKKVADVCLSEVTDAADECETATNMYVCVKREKDANGIPLMDLEP